MISLSQFITEKFNDDKIAEVFKYMKSHLSKYDFNGFKNLFINYWDISGSPFAFDKVENPGVVEITDADSLKLFKSIMNKASRQNHSKLAIVERRDVAKDDNRKYMFFKSSTKISFFIGGSKLETVKYSERSLADLFDVEHEEYTAYVYDLSTYSTSELRDERYLSKEGALITPEDVENYRKKMIEDRKKLLVKKRSARLTKEVDALIDEAMDKMYEAQKFMSRIKSDDTVEDAVKESIAAAITKVIYPDNKDSHVTVIINKLLDAKSDTDAGYSYSEKSVQKYMDELRTRISVIDEYLNNVKGMKMYQ